MNLTAYLRRIGFEGRARVDRATLDAIQGRHLLSIAYENLDVQLGRPLTTDPEAAFDKLVTRGRGGWCYEMNGVMGAALAEIGFPVTRLAGAVMRSAAGDGNIGNHLVLRLDFQAGPVLADVGLGDGPFTPFPIADGPFTARGLDFRLERLDGDWWRMHNHRIARPPNFDFHLGNEAESVLAAKCRDLQTDPQSLFVQNLVCQRFTPEGHVSLIGRVLRDVGPQRMTERLLGSADDLIETLGARFGLKDPDIGDLWPRVVARHEAVFAAEVQASSSMSQ